MGVLDSSILSSLNHTELLQGAPRPESNKLASPKLRQKGCLTNAPQQGRDSPKPTRVSELQLLGPLELPNLYEAQSAGLLWAYFVSIRLMA